VDGDSVWIPAGMKVLLDVPTAKLNLVTIEGLLQFENRADIDLKMHVRYFLIKDGALVIGEPDAPFLGKAKIECWGDKMDKKLPEFGSKFIGVKGGLISLHGQAPSHSWTRLADTAPAGANSIVIPHEVDWAVGSTIVIASTGFDHNES